MALKSKTICCGISRFTITLVLAVGLFASAQAADLPLEPAALDYTHTRALWLADPNLTGQDILIASVCRSMTYINDKPQNDYRFNMDHNCLYRSDVAFADGTDGRFGISSHATAVAGILIGQDDKPEFGEIGSFQYQGVCPAASVDVYEFWRFVTMHLFDKQPFQADIITLSLGEKYEDWWTRAFENLAMEKNIIVIASIGNGYQTYDMLYPGAGSNVIGVGVIDAVTDANGVVSLREFSVPRPEHSSSGPTDDQRCKPDIVAPGTALVPVHNNSTGYVIEENWSSLAAPIVSGTTALLLQKVYSDDALAAAFDRPEKIGVMKAILMNSAAKLPFWHKGQITADDDNQAPLDFTQGAGALDAAAAMEQLTAGLQGPGLVGQTGWDNRVLDANTTRYDYTLEAVEPNQMLTATLCWNYHYQNKYPFHHLLEKDTNLRLELWGIDPDNPDNQTLVDFCDSVNDNVEHLYFKTDGRFSTYRLVVLFSESQPAGADTRQRYAAAWSVGSDTSLGNKWWYDLNGDNKIDSLDKFVYLMIDHQMTAALESPFAKDALKLTSQRTELLTTGWENWKCYLSDWQIIYGDSGPLVP